MKEPQWTPKVIATLQSDFGSKFGLPRQSGLLQGVPAKIVPTPEYRVPEAFRGIEGYSHLWLLWSFSEAIREGGKWSPTVRPPRLGGNRRMGVFATRSPFRPNALGLSCVELTGLEEREGLGTVLVVKGADLMDGTPIYDIKPYVPYADCHPEALSGFAPDPGRTLAVEFAPGTAKKIPADKLDALRGVLENDPRPRYQNDSERVYALSFGGMEIRFTVEGDTLTVREATDGAKEKP